MQGMRMLCEVGINPYQDDSPKPQLQLHFGGCPLCDDHFHSIVCIRILSFHCTILSGEVAGEEKHKKKSSFIYLKDENLK